MPRSRRARLRHAARTSQAILDAVAKRARSTREVRLVISNVADAQGLARARAAGVPTRVVSHSDLRRSRELRRRARRGAARGAASSASCSPASCASSRRCSSTRSRTAWSTSTPRSCRRFPGVDAQAQALAYGVRVTGCTVHLVDAGTDTGPILAQAAVPVLDGRHRDTLAARILGREHELLVRGAAAGSPRAGSRCSPASGATRLVRRWLTALLRWSAADAWRAGDARQALRRRRPRPLARRAHRRGAARAARLHGARARPGRAARPTYRFDGRTLRRRAFTMLAADVARVAARRRRARAVADLEAPRRAGCRR